MSNGASQCAICEVQGPCYHVCCGIIFVCRPCLQDEDNLLNYNECFQCYRSLGNAYRGIIKSIKATQAQNWQTHKTFPNSRPKTPQGTSRHNQGNSQFRNNFGFQESRHQVEEEFEFAETLEKRQSQVQKFSNGFASQFRSNSNQYQQENFSQQASSQTFAQNRQFSNAGNASFNQRNNFGQNQFNNNRNQCFESQNRPNQNSFNPNLGFRHHQEMQWNQNYNQNRGFNDSGNENNEFTQNIRRNKPQNQNNFQQNNHQNNFSNNGQFQNRSQQQANFGPANNSNPFSMWNQQKSNGFQQNNNFGQQNQGNFNQSQGKNSFQFNNSFQNGNSYERETKSVGKVQQLRRTNTFQGSSNGFKSGSFGKNSNSDKEHSPTFGTGGEGNNDSSFNGALVPYGGEQNGGREMEIEHDGQELLKRTKSHDSLMAFGRGDHSTN